MSFTTDMAQCTCSDCARIMDALAFDATSPGTAVPPGAAVQFEGEAVPRVLPLTEIAPESGNEFVDSMINNGRHYVNPEGTEGPFVVDYFFDQIDGPVNPETGRGTPYDWRPFEMRAWQQAAETWLFRVSCGRYVMSSKRRRSRSSLARPYMDRLSSFSLVTCPSA